MPVKSGPWVVKALLLGGSLHHLPPKGSRKSRKHHWRRGEFIFLNASEHPTKNHWFWCSEELAAKAFVCRELHK